MGSTELLQNDEYGYHFIKSDYIPDGKDEYYLRDIQSNAANKNWRNLKSSEIELLVKNGNLCANWDDILVTDPFDPMQVRNNSFHGLVRLGVIQNKLIRYNDFTLPCGITNCRIISCDIGDDCAIHSCSYICHYIIGDRVILNCIDEMETTNHSKFGNGIIKKGEDEEVRVWIDPLNEAGGRSVLPFEDMTCADAYIWMTYRDDSTMLSRLVDITQNSYDDRRGWYGTVDDNCVIKSCGVIKDVKIGSCCYIKGAHKLKNLTIRSDAAEPTQIGEGVELVNGIIGFGCRVFYGCKAIRFVMGTNCSLKYGARLINSILGDNSTISCCEVLNNLVFAGHEQHHNNSFLIATCVMGQSNMAAGATVGSNHNSRGNDGEIIAGRGFWPGLSSTLKHNCRFASFTLISKGNYPSELNIVFPFSMLVDNTCQNHREVMPAYYWMYNMYALERNSWKYKKRDRREHVFQHLEFDYLAPDTVGEMMNAIQVLETLIGKAWLRSLNEPVENVTVSELRKTGYGVCAQCRTLPPEIEVWGENIERSKKPVKILKAAESYHAYRTMLCYYAVKTIAAYSSSLCAERRFGRCGVSFNEIQQAFPAELYRPWVNIGGQLVPEERIDDLRRRIDDGSLTTWRAIHDVYDELHEMYDDDRVRDALFVLRYLAQDDVISSDKWDAFKKEVHSIRAYIEEQVFYTKAKDYKNYFRNITYRNENERKAVIGCIEESPFIAAAKDQSVTILTMIDSVTF